MLSHPCSVQRGHTVNSTDLVIRGVTQEDFPQWCPLWDGYNKFYGRSGPTALPAEVTQMTRARFFDSYEPVHALVAQSEQRLVGLVPMEFLAPRAAQRASV